MRLGKWKLSSDLLSGKLARVNNKVRGSALHGLAQNFIILELEFNLQFFDAHFCARSSNLQSFNGAAIYVGRAATFALTFTLQLN